MECVRRRAARSLRVLCSFVPNSFAEMTSHAAGDKLRLRCATAAQRVCRAAQIPQETRPRLCC